MGGRPLVLKYSPERSAALLERAHKMNPSLETTRTERLLVNWSQRSVDAISETA